MEKNSIIISEETFIMSEPVEQEELEQEDDVCPVCKGVDVLHQGRCTTCMECGWSKCDI